MILAACSPSSQSMARSNRLLIYAPSQQTLSPQDRPSIEIRQSTIFMAYVFLTAISPVAQEDQKNCANNDRRNPQHVTLRFSPYQNRDRNCSCNGDQNRPHLGDADNVEWNRVWPHGSYYVMRHTAFTNPYARGRPESPTATSPRR
jgi:hypothetical protein